MARLGVFYGWRVVGAAFVLAAFGMGLGFYGPPIYLQAVRDARGWSLPLVSAAVTVHFLVGAGVVANLPTLYRRFGLPAVTKSGVVALAIGICGWSWAEQPWQLFAASFLSGAGWVVMSVAAINAIVSPWFVRARPAALAMAYNGANIGGIVFPPLWVACIGWLGFSAAALLIGALTIVVVWVLADTIVSRTPQQMGSAPDGDEPGASTATNAAPTASPLPGALLWRDLRFATLASGTALGLFAQIGLIAHLLSFLVPVLGVQFAGLAVSCAAASAIVGRTIVGWSMPAGVDRRLLAAASYLVQIAGVIAFNWAGQSISLLLLGVVLFGAGIGNGTYLPPLIAQAEFDKQDVQRVVALIVAIGQGTFAFAPAVFGMVREYASAPTFLFVAGVVQAAAICCFLAGRWRQG